MFLAKDVFNFRSEFSYSFCIRKCVIAFLSQSKRQRNIDKCHTQELFIVLAGIHTCVGIHLIIDKFIGRTIHLFHVTWNCNTNSTSADLQFYGKFFSFFCHRSISFNYFSSLKSAMHLLTSLISFDNFDLAFSISPLLISIILAIIKLS